MNEFFLEFDKICVSRKSFIKKTISLISYKTYCYSFVKLQISKSFLAFTNYFLQLCGAICNFCNICLCKGIKPDVIMQMLTIYRVKRLVLR